MESSDDDFVWSNASTCSEVSDIEHTMSESESDEKYKKKLFEEETEAGVKAELINGKARHESGSQELDSPTSRAPSPLPPSRKRKREREGAPSHGSKPDLHLLEKSVKRELSVSHAHNDVHKGNEMKDETNINDSSQELDSPASRAPTPLPPSRKRKRERERAPSHGSEPDLHLLEKRVKKELSVSHAYNDAHEGNEMKDETNINDSSQELDETVNISETLKKKKSKRNSVRQLNITNDENETEVIIEEKFHAEESFVAFRHQSRLPNEDAQETEQVIENGTAHKSKKGKKKKHRDQKHSEDSQIESQSVEFENINHNDSISKDDNDTLDNEVTGQTNLTALLKRTTKITDRIHFEDEDPIEAGQSESTNTHTSQLQRFLRTYPRLQPFRAQPHLAAFSKDEDIWLLNCPTEIDITSLQGIDMALDSKSKLKTNNQTYIGNIQNENSSIPILIFEHKKPIVKSIILNGIVSYRKRIPKPHYINDNMIQNQSDFIPLPETKYRHPLFGPDYKKAIKIPSAVKARLNNSYVSDNVALLERKKKKNKTKCKEEYVQNSSAIENEVERRAESGKSGGGRKQRHSTLVESQSAPTKKKKKSYKQEVSIGSWDSEKAIEENLFHF